MLPLTCPESESLQGVKGHQGAPLSTITEVEIGREGVACNVVYGQLDLSDDLLEHTALIVFPIMWTVSVMQGACEVTGTKT
jgi:hypothetical protein